MGFRVVVEKKEEEVPPLSEATIMVRVEDQVEHTAAVGEGPVNALDHALRKALESSTRNSGGQTPRLQGTDSLVQGWDRRQTRVLIESGDGKSEWGTVGVSENIIQASWQALVDSIDYKLLKKRRNGINPLRIVECGFRGLTYRTVRSFCKFQTRKTLWSNSKSFRIIFPSPAGGSPGPCSPHPIRSLPSLLRSFLSPFSRGWPGNRSGGFRRGSHHPGIHLFKNRSP